MPTAVALIGAAGAGFCLFHRPAATPPVAAPAQVAPGDDELPDPCEAYLREIEHCVATHPEMAALRANAPEQRAAFKAGLASPPSRQAILDSCGQAFKALHDACK